MKKWLTAALAALLLATMVGCDDANDTAKDTDDTTAVETVTETPAVTEASTVPDTEVVTEPQTEAETERETEALSAEEVSALLDSLLMEAAEKVAEPIELTIEGEVKVTATVYGFSGTTILPLSGYYGADAEGNVAATYAIPMVGSGFCMVVDRMLYLCDGGETAIKCDLGDEALGEVTTIILEQIMARLEASLPSLEMPEFTLPDGYESDVAIPEARLEEMPEATLPDIDLSALMGNALTAIPVEDAFQSVTAVRDVETGEVTLTLSGLSDSLLAAMESVMDAVAVCYDLRDETPDYATLNTLIALLREQAETALTVTVSVNPEGELLSVTYATSLDLREAPELTNDMPMVLDSSVTVSVNRTGISVEAPAETDRYTEVKLRDLLPLETETESIGE